MRGVKKTLFQKLQNVKSKMCAGKATATDLTAAAKAYVTDAVAKGNKTKAEAEALAMLLEGAEMFAPTIFKPAIKGDIGDDDDMVNGNCRSTTSTATVTKFTAMKMSRWLVTVMNRWLDMVTQFNQKRLFPIFGMPFHFIY